MDGGLGTAQDVLSPLWRAPLTQLVSGPVEAVLLLLQGRHSPLGLWAGVPSWASTAQDNGCACSLRGTGVYLHCQGDSRGDFSWQCPLPGADMAAAL